MGMNGKPLLNSGMEQTSNNYIVQTNVIILISYLDKLVVITDRQRIIQGWFH